VGIRLYDAGGQRPWLFVGQGSTGKGGGWYPVQHQATPVGDSGFGYRQYQLDFTATLEPLPGQEVTPGAVSASAHVIIKVQ